MKGLSRHCLIVAAALALLSAPASAWAACTSPAGDESTMRYDFTAHVLYLCTGTSWLTMSGGGSSSGTAGYIQFSGGSGAFSSDSTSGGQLFWDSTNHRLGIGTATPGDKLEVNGAIIARGATGTPSIAMLGDIDEAKWAMHLGTYRLSFMNDNSDTTAISGTSDVTAYSRTFRDKIAFTHTGNALVSGNIGIGTGGPLARLSIQGNTSSTAWGANGVGIRQSAATYTDTSSSGTVASNYINTIAQPTLAASSATTYTNAGTLYIYNAPAAGTNVTITNPLAFYVAAGASSFGGNVGIGTTAPGSLLDVRGGLAVNRSSTALVADTAGTLRVVAGADGSAQNAAVFGYAGSDNIGVGVNLRKARGTISSPTTVANGDRSGMIRFQPYDGTQVIDGARIEAVVSGTVTTGSVPTDLSFSTGSTTSVPSERMRITSAGNVGIGTTTPAYKLDVNGNVQAAAYFYSSDRRLKTDIAPLPAQLGKIAALEPVSYVLKSDPEHRVRLGLIAQDVEAVYPQVVHGPGDAMKAVDYAALVSPLIAAVKELKAANDNLAAEVEALKAQSQGVPGISEYTPAPARSGRARSFNR